MLVSLTRTGLETIARLDSTKTRLYQKLSRNRNRVSEANNTVKTSVNPSLIDHLFSFNNKAGKSQGVYSVCTRGNRPTN
jgi:hypothetical protein